MEIPLKENQNENHRYQSPRRLRKGRPQNHHRPDEWLHPDQPLY